MRVLGAVVAMLLLGLLAGGVAAYVVEPAPVGAVGADVPLASASPAVPTTPVEATIEPLADIDYPALEPVAAFRTRTISNGYTTWRYPSPRGWDTYCVGAGGVETLVSGDESDDCTEVRFRPAGEPVTGGYSLRVKAITTRESTLTMVAGKIAGLQGSPGVEDPTVLSQDVDSVHATLLTPTELDGGGYLLRHNYFRWFAAPGSTESTLEMSVAGRAVDAAGLEDLFQTFAARAEAVS